MNIVLLTNDNYFSFKVLRSFLEKRKKDIILIVFSSALIGDRDLFHSIIWLLRHTGVKHSLFKLLVYGIFKVMGGICKILPFIPNQYTTCLWAKRNKIAIITTPNINRSDVIENIRSVKPDLIISVSMNQILKKDLLHIPSKRCINVHCSPLPRYGGMSPYVWILAHNYGYSAATIHYMEEGLDEGDILVQETEKVMKNDSAFSLFSRCCSLAEPLLVKVVNDIESGTAKSFPQELSNKTYFSWPNRDCISSLHRNGYSLAKISDFIGALLGKEQYRTPQK